MVGNWSKEMDLTLSQALSYTYQVSGRSLAEACKHAIILMAQSARKLTKQARKNRRKMRDEHGEYYERITKTGVKKIYRWAFDKPEVRRTLKSWEHVRLVPNRGLAKRSWMWGLASLNKPPKSKPMGRVSTINKYLTRDKGGFVLTNKLNYIERAMPAGWKIIVERAAINRVMKQAQLRLQRKWERSVARSRALGRTTPDMGKYINEAS